MYKAVFRIDGDSPYSKSTSGTDTEIKLWCNDHCDLLYVTGERQDDVISHVRSEVGVDEQLEDHNGQFVITKDCLAEQAGDYIRPYLVANNCLLFPPWQYENGTKVVRVLALDPANLSSFYRDISSEYSVIVESKRKLAKVESETPMLSMRSQFPTLTDRQREVFLIAHERGYYEIPRDTTTAEIADAVGVGRRTVEDHLRRAEAKFADLFAARL